MVFTFFVYPTHLANMSLDDFLQEQKEPYASGVHSENKKGTA